MTDCFPEVVMPPPEPEEPTDPLPLPLTDQVIQEQMDLDEEGGAYEVEEEEEEEEEEIIPEPVRRPKLAQEEIFSAPKVKTILEPEVSEAGGYVAKGRTKSGLGTRKKRGPCTPEQLERLAKGREKAKETRERKKLEKEEKKSKDKEDKDLVEAVRERERKKLRKKLERPIEDDEPPSQKQSVKIIEKDRIIEKGYSKEDLDEAVQRAVEQSVNRVETLRKQRKEVKKKVEAKAKHDEKVFKEINSALKNDVWANCFL
tara:strand:- start:1869 stop:2642 length:774 start_codon:yes stop_codon:yes gene_type:complete